MKSWKGAILVSVMTLVALAALYLVDHAMFWRYERNVVVTASRMSVKESKKVDAEVLFVGNSIMDMYPMASHWGNRFEYRNIGVGGLGIRQIARQYRDIGTTIPRDVLVVEGGLNDVLGCAQRKDCTQEQVVDLVTDGMKQIIDVEMQHGDSAVYVLSITPVTNKFLLPYLRAFPLPTAFDPSLTNSYIDYVNTHVKKMCVSYNSDRVRYVDVSSPLKIKGALNRQYGAADGYHINQEGYQVVSSVVEENILKNLPIVVQK